MNHLLAFAVHNTIFAMVLALFVYGLTRVWRSPPVAHVLWLLVLLKLVAPPLMFFDWSAFRLADWTLASDQVIATPPQMEAAAFGNAARLVESSGVQATFELPAGLTSHDGFTAGVSQFCLAIRPILFWCWIGGAAVCVLVIATRIIRFERLLRDTLPASERLYRLTAEIAGNMGIRVPDLRYVEGADIPLVWCAGRRPTIVLPMRLIQQLDDRQIAMILAHELAHLRRRDHWVRAVELVVSAVYWWNPLVWVIRRQIHEAEDLCCDAWVRWSIPDCTKGYAEVVLKTAESLSRSQVSAQLLPASPLLRSLSLKARIEMILESKFAPQMSSKSMFLSGLVAVLVLPAFVQTTATKVLADSNDESSASAVELRDTATNAAFPHKVDFEQGATSFERGDSITILEVRGTAKTFIPGNIYWIKGRYKLGSRDQAMLAAYTTATKSDGIGRSFKVQSMNVEKGKGTFTLFLPMSYEGLPHVSFYDGTCIGGNYFGTGDSVLKKYWGTK